jgi:hypothetical protein
MVETIKKWIWRITPRMYECKDVFYIRWLGGEWVIPKDKKRW